MEENKNFGKELFSKTVKAGQRTYFINVKESTKGNKYITLTEAKRIDNDKFEKSRIMLFQDKVAEFIGAVQEASLVAA